jgi:hypothetical protein
LSPVHVIDGVWDAITETAYRNAAEQENMPPYLCVQPANEEQLPPKLRALIFDDVEIVAGDSDSKKLAEQEETSRALAQQENNHVKDVVDATSDVIVAADLESDKTDLDTDVKVNAPDELGTDKIASSAQPEATPLKQQQPMRSSSKGS